MNLLEILFHFIGVYQDLIKATSTKHTQRFHRVIIEDALTRGRGISQTKEYTWKSDMRQLVQKAVFHSSTSFIHTKLYAEFKSRQLK